MDTLWMTLIYIAGLAVTIIGLYRSIEAYLYWTRNYHGELITEGVYSQTRHPFYSGFIIMALGISITKPTMETILLAAISAVGAAIYIQIEEKNLLQKYNKEYLEYKRKTPWKIIPGIY